MKMSQVFSINRVFLHKLHQPPCCLGNFADWRRQFHDYDRDTRSQSQNEEGPSRLSLQMTSVWFWHNLPHWGISKGLIRWWNYEIYLLFLLLVKFHVSGKCEIYSPVQRILQCFSLCVILSVDTENADPLFLNVIFVKMVSELQGGINSFCISKLDMMLGLQSRDKWSLNNCDAIEIKSIGFYASNVTIPYFQNLTLTLKEGGIGAY